MRPIPVLNFLKDKTEARRRELAAALVSADNVRDRLAAIRRVSQLTYKVELVSLWEKEGEKTVTVKVKGSLQKAMQTAIAEFKKVNRRGDVQALHRVWAILPGKPTVSIEIDKSQWEHLKDHL